MKRASILNKKLALKAIAILLVVGAVAGSVVLLGENDKRTDTSVSTDAGSHNTSGACELFSLDDAKEILGDEVMQSVPEEPQHESSAVAVTACGYSAHSVVDHATVVNSASLTVLSPLSEDGATANQVQVASIAENATEVEGYDQAYWVESSSELIVLKNSTLLIISTSKVTSPQDSLTTEGIEPTPGNLDEAKKVADLVLPKL